jgi:hypothetical protein
MQITGADPILPREIAFNGPFYGGRPWRTGSSRTTWCSAFTRCSTGCCSRWRSSSSASSFRHGTCTTRPRRSNGTSQREILRATQANKVRLDRSCPVPLRHFLSSACGRDQAFGGQSRRADPSGPQFQLRGRGRRLVASRVDGPTRTGGSAPARSNDGKCLIGANFRRSPCDPAMTARLGRPFIRRKLPAIFRNECYAPRRPPLRSGCFPPERSTDFARLGNQD